MKSGWRAMNWWRNRGAKKTLTEVTSNGPIIHTPNGPTSEWARRQAAENLRSDPEKMAQVREMIGEEEMRRRFPEAFSADEA